MTHPARTPRVMNGQSRTADKFVVRLEDGLRDRIAVLAHQQGRSMNSYVVRALSKTASEDESGLTSVRPLFTQGMACRYNGVPKILLSLQIHESEEFIEGLIDIGDSQAWVPLEDLEPY